MVWKTIPLLFAFLLLLPPSVMAADSGVREREPSQHIVKFWRTEHGLPENSIGAITQTTDGYLWLGTEAGLVRFDGVRFIVFTMADSPGLGANEISALAPGDAGSLWIGLANGGLSAWTNGSIRQVVASNFQETGAIRSLHATESGVLVGSDRGLFRWSERDSLQAIGKTNRTGAVLAFSEDLHGMIWLGTENGVWRLENGQLAGSALRGVRISSITAAPDGTIWIAGGGAGLLELTPEVSAPRRVWAISEIKLFCRSRSGEIWVASGSGRLEKFVPGANAAERVQIPALAARCLFEDREGSLWLGSAGFGLAQVRPKTLKLITPADGMSSPGVLSVTEGSAGQVWFAAESGKIYRVTNEVAVPVELPDVTPRFYVEALLASRAGGVWVGSRFDGLNYWPAEGGRLLKRSNAAGIAALFEDRHGRLWVGTASEGVLLWDGGKLRTIQSPEGPIREATCFAEDQEGRIWIGTRRSGLAEWREGSLQWHRFEASAGTANIFCLYADVEGTLWMGTDHGLVARREGRFHTATTRQGLYDDSIHQVLEDFRGNFWCLSGRGIFRVRKSELNELFARKIPSVASIPFAGEEGYGILQGSGEAQPASVKTADGKLWFATRRGLAVIDRTKSASIDAPLPAVIEEVRVDNRHAAAHGEAGPADVLSIPAGYNHLLIRFTAPTFIAPERTQFRFQLTGIDVDWVQAGANRIASYGRMPAGEYRFEVAARNRDGAWPESGAVMRLKIAPRYWETGWFKGLIAAGLLGVAALFWIQRMHRAKEVNLVRQQITRDLHDDLGSNVGSIALLSEALQKPGAESQGPTRELLLEINRIARQTLESMRDAVWFVDPEKDTPVSLISHLRQLADSMLKGVRHEFHEPDRVEARAVPLELKRGIVLIFKEALYNVSRHAEATQVDISIRAERNRFSFRVRDNGRGFDTTEAQGGHGLKNMKYRAEKMGANLVLTSAPGRGTELSFEAKLS